MQSLEDHVTKEYSNIKGRSRSRLVTNLQNLVSTGTVVVEI